jgi:hypothetical protein
MIDGIATDTDCYSGLSSVLYNLNHFQVLPNVRIMVVMVDGPGMFGGECEGSVTSAKPFGTPKPGDGKPPKLAQ